MEQPVSNMTDLNALFRHNGFYIFRNAIPQDEADRLAKFIKAGYGVDEMDLFTRADIVNQVPELTKYIYDPRIVESAPAWEMKLALFNKVTSTRIMSRMAGIEIQRIEALALVETGTKAILHIK